jgi:hypothetical protein
VKREGDRITVARYLMNELPAPFHKQMGGFPDGMKVDRWQVTHYGPPSSSGSTSARLRWARRFARASAARA